MRNPDEIAAACRSVWGSLESMTSAGRDVRKRLNKEILMASVALGALEWAMMREEESVPGVSEAFSKTLDGLINIEEEWSEDIGGEG